MAGEVADSLLKQSSNGGKGGGDDAGEIGVFKFLSGLRDGLLRSSLLFFSVVQSFSSVVFLLFAYNLALSSRDFTDFCFLSVRKNLLVDFYPFGEAKSHPRLKLLRSKYLIGWGSERNNGIRKAVALRDCEKNFGGLMSATLPPH